MARIPPLVNQAALEQCWAACLESYTNVSSCPTRDQGYFALWYAANPNGGLQYNGTKYKKLLMDYGFTDQVVLAGQFTDAMAQSMLNLHSYFMFITKLGNNYSHARLAYQCRNNTLWTMDPDPNATGYPHFILSTLPEVLVLKL